jgi:hypothetical protein
MSFAHLTIATRDVPKTRDFFMRAMRWEPINIPSNTPLEAAWLTISAGQQLHILYVKDFIASDFEAEFGRHFALFHPHADFPDLKKRLIEQGATLIDPIRPTAFERFYFRDLNGYVFEVIAREQYVVE